MKSLSVVLVLVSFMMSAAVWSETLTIRSDNWYPINGEAGTDKQGFMIDIAAAIMKKHDISVDYQTMPWERSLREVRDGAYDCVVGAYKEDAPDFIFPDEAWGMDQNIFYVTKNNPWVYKGMESLKGQSIGLIGGYAYEEEFDKHAEANKRSGGFQFVNADNALEQNIKKLLSNRITATVESPLVMAAKLKEMGLAGKLTPAGHLSEPTEMYIACAPNSERTAKFVKLLSEGLRELRASGELTRILDHYGLQDWK